jgi:predicted AlkP superfamily pyrophosphatase or phosphodiesterase
MRRLSSTIPFALVAALAACADTADDGASLPSPEGPSLGVLVVVDQLRGDLLDRYDDLFTGGFRRLLDGGAVFTNATHDHASTSTAPGHATLATGVHPRTHGISGNTWFEQVGDRWREVYAVSDTSVEILADPGLPGRSPANLRAEGIGDWLAAARPDARIVGISRKDRGSIPLAGKAGQDVYWLALEDGVGGFTTSTWYHESLPEWVREANAALGPGLWGDTVWSFAAADSLRTRARRDDHPGEADGVHTTFPHHAHVEVDMMDRGAWGDWLENAPPPDAAVTTLALAALEARELGLRGTVDLLALSYSSTDGVGHTFGPLSQEQLDNLLKLDRELGRLMDALDAHVGEDRWTLALSADHGVLDLPEARAEAGLPADRVSAADLAAADAALAGVPVGDGGIAVAEALRGAGLVAEAYPFAELRTSGEARDRFMPLDRNGWVEDRVLSFPGLDVDVRHPEGTYDDEFGTGHGSPYHYDRWVPFIVYGAAVSASRRPEPVSTTDFAPTLAARLGLTPPAGLAGRDVLR